VQGEISLDDPEAALREPRACDDYSPSGSASPSMISLIISTHSSQM
jgi:hypothetical protein